MGQYKPDNYSPDQKKGFISSVRGALAALVIFLAALIAVIDGGPQALQALGQVFHVGANTSAPPAPAATTTPLVTVGRLLYSTSSGGACDLYGAKWSQNQVLTQSCGGGALTLSVTQCCTDGVATLYSLPGMSYPAEYIAQVTTENISDDSSAKWGFKFRQQSIDDTGNGRGGYSFLVDSSGQWQFNMYDEDGTRHILDQQQLGKTLTGTHVLDLVVQGNTYTFYIDGSTPIAQKSDTTYSSGYFCLAAEPNADTRYSSLALYALP